MTDQDKSQEQLISELAQQRQLAERLALAIRTASVGIWDFDVLNDKLVWDDSMFQLYGVNPADFVGAYEAWQATVHPQDLERADAEVQAALRGEKEFDTEFRVVWPNRSVHWIKAHATVHRDASGRAVRMLGTNWDITQRKLADDTLRESEHRLHTICNSALDAVVMVDSNGRAVYWNPAAEKMFGYSCQEMMGRDVHAILTPDRYCEQAIDAFNAFRITGRGRAVGTVLELAALRKDGTEFPIEIALSGFKMADKWCAAAIIRDVTERKKVLESLEQEKKSLKLMLGSSDHERQAIAYDIHDGLAQQIAGAVMQFERFSGMPSESPEAAAKVFATGMALLRQSHAEVRRLIGGLRTFVLDGIDLRAAIAHLVNDHTVEGGPTIQFRSKFECERFSPELENAMYRIVQEGLTNACKHSKSRRVKLLLTQRGPWLRITIRDWGIGFAADSVSEGRFGLEGIRQRARLLGGGAEFTSAPGEGVRIVVTLPVSVP